MRINFLTQQKWFLVFTFCIGISFYGFANDAEDCQKIIKSGVDAAGKGDFITALEYLYKAKLMAENKGLHEKHFIANYNLGLVYYDLQDYAEAMHYNQQAHHIATEHLDETFEMLILNNIAIIYSLDKNYEKGEFYFQRAYKIAQKGNNTAQLAQYAINLGWLANQTDSLDKAKDYLEKSLDYLKAEKGSLMYQQARLNLAENFLKRGDFEASKAILEELIKDPEILNYKRDYNEALFFLASVHAAQNNAEKAINFASKALEDNDKYESKILIFNKLSEIYQKTGDYHKTLRYKDSVISTKGQWENFKQLKIFENNKFKFELQDYINELEVNKEKLKAERILFGSVIVIVLLLCFLTYRFYRIKFIHEKQKKKIAEREQEIISLELDNEKKEYQILENQVRELETQTKIEQELLKNEIEQKNRTLSAKALFLSGRNEMIEEIINSLEKLPEISNNKKIKDNLRVLTRHVKTDLEWESFFSHFEEVNPGLLNNLKELHPKLTPNDVRFLCYIYMNLSTKEICLIFNITPEACRKRKERIAKKMDLEDSNTLYSYISRLTNPVYKSS